MIILYTKDNCQACISTKDLLISQNAPFIEENVAESQNALEIALSKSQSLSTPVLDIDGTIIVGYSKKRILNELRKKKERKTTSRSKETQ